MSSALPTGPTAKIQPAQIRLILPAVADPLITMRKMTPDVQKWAL